MSVHNTKSTNNITCKSLHHLYDSMTEPLKYTVDFTFTKAHSLYSN